MKLLFCLLATLGFMKPLFANQNINVSSTDTLDVSTIIEKSESAYSNLKIYLDSGKVVTSYSNLAHPHKTAKLFKTAYSKTGDFNFEYYDLGSSNSLYTINRSSNIVKTWWGTTNETKTPTTLHAALSAALGVSSSTSFIIPGILLTNDFAYKTTIYHTLGNSVINGNELVNGIICYKITGITHTGKKTIIWISKKDFMIRKIEIETTIDPAKTTAILHKADSIDRAQHARDTAYLKKDSIRQAKFAKTNAIISLLLPEHKPSTQPFVVKNTYFFFPYTLKKLNPELFKFRPNREIAL